jgi:hypothetical protein
MDVVHPFCWRLRPKKRKFISKNRYQLPKTVSKLYLNTTKIKFGVWPLPPFGRIPCLNFLFKWRAPKGPTWAVHNRHLSKRYGLEYPFVWLKGIPHPKVNTKNWYKQECFLFWTLLEKFHKWKQFDRLSYLGHHRNYIKPMLIEQERTITEFRCLATKTKNWLKLL